MAELDPQVSDYLDFLDELGQPDLADVGAEQARELSAAFLSDPSDREDVAATEDRTVPGPDGEIPIRVYTPRTDGGGPHPALAFFHGGGFVLGDLETHDAACRALANAADCVIVAADYRRAPEHPFPAAVEDCFAVTEWVAENPAAVGGDGRLAVGGDSAGGNLAAAVTLLARERRGPAIDAQLLIYPVTSASTHWDSYENAEGYYLTEADMRWFEEQYFPSDLNRANPYASPLRAASHAGLPPATVQTCGFDPLRDEGRAYADALAEAGVPTTHYHYDDLVHGVFTMLVEPGIDRTRDVVEDAAAGLRADLSD
ncbi:alpha/beta hydrolase [Halostella sp. JP-L12]|uniref:alpha/beta hydrolase n=1 Tax=Halostella TaxID=1843185 RepID=UPI000EF78E4C|nr:MULTISPECIES: alpha/beta hydrolase [Halostella]NHN49143.1 alpha/beta hydrolase [Halostella sp. JP-L12]